MKTQKTQATHIPAQDMERLYHSVKDILEASRNRAYRAVNAEMVQAYWHIGRVIVEEEQQGKGRANYGMALLQGLSQKLKTEYGHGFTVTNLRYMRQVYLAFKKHHAMRGELSWTHYRILIKVKDEAARTFYLEEAIVCRWSYRELERQIGVKLYERTNEYRLYLPSEEELSCYIAQETERLKLEQRLEDHLLQGTTPTYQRPPSNAPG